MAPNTTLGAPARSPKSAAVGGIFWPSAPTVGSPRGSGLGPAIQSSAGSSHPCTWTAAVAPPVSFDSFPGKNCSLLFVVLLLLSVVVVAAPPSMPSLRLHPWSCGPGPPPLVLAVPICGTRVARPRTFVSTRTLGGGVSVSNIPGGKKKVCPHPWSSCSVPHPWK